MYSTVTVALHLSSLKEFVTDLQLIRAANGSGEEWTVALSTDLGHDGVLKVPACQARHGGHALGKASRHAIRLVCNVPS